MNESRILCIVCPAVTKLKYPCGQHTASKRIDMLVSLTLVAAVICFGSQLTRSNAQEEPRSRTETSEPAHPTLFISTTTAACVAHTARASESSGTTSAGQQQPQPTVEIVVGAAGKLVFDPPAVNASKGTLLRFSFPGINHTLTQSSFEHPCKKAGAFDTDLNRFNPANISGAFVVDFVVDTTDPQWFFCAQTLKSSHCNAGMVFSLNVGEKASAFVEEARTATQSFSDGPNLRTGDYCPFTASGPGTTRTPILNTTQAPYLNATQASIPSFVLSGYLASLSSGGRIGPSSTAISPPISNEATSMSPSRLVHAGFIIAFAVLYI